MANNVSPLELLGVKRVEGNWISYLILGVLLVILGILAIIGANVVTMGTILFFGVLLVIGGVLQIIYAFLARSGQGFAQALLLGIFYTITGILMVTHPTVLALAITLLFAAFFTVSGIFKIVLSLTTPAIEWYWLLISGIVSLILGILIWSEWPYSALWVIGLFIGIDLIVIGWYWIMQSVATKMRRIA